MLLLDVKNLSVTYTHHDQEIRAVDRVSFAIETGEIVAVVGESGSGKSSLGLALTQLLISPQARIQADHVLFQETSLLEASEDALQRIRGGRIAYVFQEPGSSLNPVLTIGKQLREVIEIHTQRRGHEANTWALEWLRRVGIPAKQLRLNAYPHEFSGGMQQRVMIAMAMASEPALLIADEPTSALDVTVQIQILRLLREFQQRFNLAILLISHDLFVVRRLAGRMLVMHQGRVVEEGITATVIRHPRHPYTKMLLEARASMAWPPLP